MFLSESCISDRFRIVLISSVLYPNIFALGLEHKVPPVSAPQLTMFIQSIYRHGLFSLSRELMHLVLVNFKIN